LDEQREILKGKNKIGTTKRGIGPAYGDKAARTGLRVIDLVNPERFRRQLEFKIRENNEILKAFGAKPLSFKTVHDQYRAAGDYLKPFVANTVVLLHEAVQRGEDILFEGAQGTFLDIDHGTYPFVTSSNTTAGGACTGSGIPPHRMDRVVGVMKAYTTRVGEGPLPTENAEIADMLHAMGREFGATTGRPRRCGWFDAVATRHACMVNGSMSWRSRTSMVWIQSKRSKFALAIVTAQSAASMCRMILRRSSAASQFMRSFPDGAPRLTMRGSGKICRLKRALT